MEKKVVYRICTIADYDREALYLSEMHAEGWKLKEVSYSSLVIAVKYTFAEFEIYNDAAGKLAMVKKILTMRMLPVLLLFSVLLPVFSKLLSGRSYFSWGMFLIVIIDFTLLMVFAIQISYIFWRLFQKWKELSDK